VRLGSIAAIRRRVLDAAGVAVLPRYLVEADLKARALKRILPSTTLLHDWFRLVFRADDPKRLVYERLAVKLAETPLQ
jgi:LysR family glycine cleavage system transcriptional activator